MPDSLYTHGHRKDRAVALPLGCSGIPQQSALRDCKPYNGLEDMAAISAEGDTALHPPRRRGGAIKPRRRAICSPRCSRRGRGSTLGRGTT